MLRMLSLTAALFAAIPAMAQNPQGAQPANPSVPVAPRDAPPERIAPSDGRPTGGNTLSNQMSRQGGTVTPPNVDPGMTVRPPPNSAGTTPVIPPPGSPGGNRSVVPK